MEEVKTFFVDDITVDEEKSKKVKPKRIYTEKQLKIIYDCVYKNYFEKYRYDENYLAACRERAKKSYRRRKEADPDFVRQSNLRCKYDYHMKKWNEIPESKTDIIEWAIQNNKPLKQIA